jgi:hypothetical protein
MGCFFILAMPSEPALASFNLHFNAPGRLAETAAPAGPMIPGKTFGADLSAHAAEQHGWLASTTADGAVWEKDKGKGKGKDDKKDENEDEDEDEDGYDDEDGHEDEDEYEDEKEEIEEDVKEETGVDDDVVTPPVPEVATSDPIEPAARPSDAVPAVLAELGSGGGSASGEPPLEDDPIKPYFENNVSGQTLAKILSYFGLQDRFAAFADDGEVDIVWLEFERKASLKGLDVLIDGTNRTPDLSATVGRLAVLIFLDQSTITRQSDVVAVFGSGSYQAARRPLR